MYTILAFTQSRSYPLDDIGGFYQLMAGSYRSDKLKSNLKTNQTLIFTEKCFFYTFLGFTLSRSYPQDDIDGFYQLIAGSYKSDKPINITGIDKIHLNCDCIQGGIVNGKREPILFSFAFSSPPGQKIYKEPRVKLSKG